MLEELKGNLSSQINHNGSPFDDEIFNLINRIDDHLEVSGKLQLTDTLKKHIFEERSDSLI